MGNREHNVLPSVEQVPQRDHVHPLPPFFTELIEFEPVWEKCLEAIQQSWQTFTLDENNKCGMLYCVACLI